MFSRRVGVVLVLVAVWGCVVAAVQQDRLSQRFPPTGDSSSSMTTRAGALRGARAGGAFDAPQSQGRGGLPTGSMAPSPRRPGQPVMVRVDITITDQRSNGAAEKKALWLLVADGDHSIIRSEERQKNTERGVSGPSLNVEASPTILQDDRIRLSVSVLYDLPEGAGDATAKADDQAWTTRVQESLGLIVENKKPIVISQSADPRSSRKVSVEVMATILR